MSWSPWMQDKGSLFYSRHTVDSLWLQHIFPAPFHPGRLAARAKRNSETLHLLCVFWWVYFSSVRAGQSQWRKKKKNHLSKYGSFELSKSKELNNLSWTHPPLIQCFQRFRNCAFRSMNIAELIKIFGSAVIWRMKTSPAKQPPWMLTACIKMRMKFKQRLSFRLKHYHLRRPCKILQLIQRPLKSWIFKLYSDGKFITSLSAASFGYIHTIRNITYSGF